MLHDNAHTPQHTLNLITSIYGSAVLGYHLFASLREHVSLQLGHVRGAKLPRPHVHRRARQLLQPQRMAGPEPQHPVHTPSGQLFLKSHSFDYYRPHPALMSSCSVNKLK